MLFSPNQKRVTTTINKEDYDYCKKKDIKFAHLIRAGVRDHRVNTGDPNADESAREIVLQRDKATAHRDKILQAIREKLGEDDFIEFIQKI